MQEKDFIAILEYIVSRGIEAIKNNTEFDSLPLDYVAIFSRDEKEFEVLKSFVAGIARLYETGKTGETYIFNNPIKISNHFLRVVKIRKPDTTRPYRGGPDFRTEDYGFFKEKYIKGGNFSLMIREDFEMIELKGHDVLVYFPNKPVTKQLGL